MAQEASGKCTVCVILSPFKITCIDTLDEVEADQPHGRRHKKRVNEYRTICRGHHRITDEELSSARFPMQRLDERF